MAERRMYSKKITDSDAFIEMSSSTQCLYFHLNQGADDDGFNNQIQVAMVKAHASADDLKVLLAKNFIIRFNTGVIVIKHWRMHNTLRKDRHTPTNYQEELKALGIKENGAYTLKSEDWLPNGCQTVAKRLPQDSIGKNSIDYNIYAQNEGQNNCIFEENCNKNTANELQNAEESTANAEEKQLQMQDFAEKNAEDYVSNEELFNQFWAEYPKKINKKGCLRKFLNIKNLKEEFPKIMNSLEAFKKTDQWAKSRGQFIPHPETWINQERWKDELSECYGRLAPEWMKEYEEKIKEVWHEGDLTEEEINEGISAGNKLFGKKIVEEEE